MTSSSRKPITLAAEPSQVANLLANLPAGVVYGKVLRTSSGQPKDFVFLDMNPAYERFIGVKKTDVIGRRASSVFSLLKEDPKWLEPYARAAFEGKSSAFEMRWPLTGRWYSVIIYSPRTGRFVSILEDIDDRKRAEQALAESEQRYRHLVQYAPTGIYEIDFRGPKFKSVNDVVSQLSGYSRDELLSMSPSDLLDEESKDRFHERIRRSLAGEQINEEVEYTVLTKDRRRLCVVLNIEPIYENGKVTGALAVGHDITERKKAEEAMRKSEEKFSKAFHSAVMGQALTRLSDGTFIDVNEQWSRISGWGRDEIIGRKSTDLDIWVQPRDAFKGEMTNRGMIEQREFQFRKKSGEIWTGLVSSELIELNEEWVVLNSTLDITEKKRAEERLFTTFQRFYEILSSMTYGVLLVAADDRVEFVNKVFCDIFGLTEEPASFVGMTADEMLGKVRGAYSDPEASVAHIKEIVAGGRPIYDEDVGMRAGRTFLRDFVPIRVGGKPYGRLWIHRDITERKEIEKELQETSSYLESLLDHASAPIIVWDPDLRITIFNHAFERLTGYESTDVIGKSLDILFPEQTKLASIAQIDRTTAGEQWESVEIPIKRRDGEVRTVLWNSATVRRSGPSGATATIAQGLDITELKAREVELLRSNAELEQFAYIASHDLQEPLRMVTSYLGLLDRKCSSQIDDEAREYMGYAIGGSKRMKSLIDDLLAYSRVTSQAKPFVRVDMNKVVEKVMLNIAEAKKESGAEIVVGRLPVVTADESQMVQLMQNLLSNAIKFRGKESPMIQVSSSSKPTEVVFAVKDNGIGLDPAYADKIFQMFRRLHSNSEYPGTGVGLAIARKIAERHGGRIWVESEEGKGATFYFSIPSSTEVRLSSESRETALDEFCGSV